MWSDILLLWQMNLLTATIVECWYVQGHQLKPPVLGARESLLMKTPDQNSVEHGLAILLMSAVLSPTTVGTRQKTLPSDIWCQKPIYRQLWWTMTTLSCLLPSTGLTKRMRWYFYFPVIQCWTVAIYLHIALFIMRCNNCKVLYSVHVLQSVTVKSATKKRFNLAISTLALVLRCVSSSVFYDLFCVVLPCNCSYTADGVIRKHIRNLKCKLY